MDIDKLKAGRALDRLIAEKVMGCHVIKRRKGTFDLVVPGGVNSVDWVEEEGAWSGMPSYSTDIAAAWKVVEHMRDLWTGWTEKCDREAAYAKFLKMPEEEKAKYLDPSGIVDAISVEMAGPKPFSDEAFFNRLHRHADRRWPWAFFYADPKAICVAALAAFPELVKAS